MASPNSKPVENQADSLLALLKDIHPAEAAWWPPAPGWWLLALLTIIILGCLANKALKAWKRYRYKMMAKAMLVDVFKQYSEQPRALLVALNQFLKRWLASQGISGVQQLTGLEWANYLQHSIALSDSEKMLIDTLSSAQYQTELDDYDVQLLQAWAQRWLNSQEVLRG